MAAPANKHKWLHVSRYDLIADADDSDAAEDTSVDCNTIPEDVDVDEPGTERNGSWSMVPGGASPMMPAMTAMPAMPIMNVNADPNARTLFTPSPAFGDLFAMSMMNAAAPTPKPSPLAASMMDTPPPAERVRQQSDIVPRNVAQPKLANVTLMLPPAAARKALAALKSTLPAQQKPAARLDRTALMAPAAALGAFSKTQLLRPVGTETTQAAPSTTKTPKPNTAFDVSVIENVNGITRYRDALAHGEKQDQALLIMTDFASKDVELNDALYTRIQESVRKAGGKGVGPNAILQLINRELVDAKVEATATCVRINLAERVMITASAGGIAPFLIRQDAHFSRVNCAPNMSLGSIRTAQFVEHTIPFTEGDAVILASTEWVTVLERLFSQPPDLVRSTLAFAMRQERAHPPNGSLLKLATA